MRHVLASRPVTARPLGVRKPPPATGLVATPRLTLTTIAGTHGTATRAIDLAAVAATADQHLDATIGAHEQPGRCGAAVIRSADFLWTNATIDGILLPHTCPARLWGTASSVTAKFRSAPCLPL